jgi:hypothetical protein
MTDLLELASRVGEATGPDQQLDFDILCVVDARAIKTGPLHSDPKFTASLDAATTLVPEGWTGEVRLDGWAQIWPNYPGGWLHERVKASAATPALALTAAALRALINLQETSRG